MHIIKPCPVCGKKLRFPIEKGKIQVKCLCGYQFIADPDNPELYQHSTFDLSPKKEENPLKTLIYELKNRDYNEKIKILAAIIIAISIIMLLVYLFKGLTTTPEKFIDNHGESITI